MSSKAQAAAGSTLFFALAPGILGQALLLWRPVVLGWAVLAGMTMAAFAKVYEEPALRRQFGESYEQYRRNVPAWRPRLTPWPGPPK